MHFDLTDKREKNRKRARESSEMNMIIRTIDRCLRRVVFVFVRSQNIIEVLSGY